MVEERRLTDITVETVEKQGLGVFISSCKEQGKRLKKNEEDHLKAVKKAQKEGLQEPQALPDTHRLLDAGCTLIKPKTFDTMSGEKITCECRLVEGKGTFGIGKSRDCRSVC